MNDSGQLPASQAGKHVLLLSFVEWNGAFQRPQHLALGLARRGWQVTYAAPNYLHRRAKRISSGLPLPGNLHVIEPPALPGVSRFTMIELLNSKLFYNVVHRTIRNDVNLIIFNDARLASVAARLPADRRVFDCMDDLSAQVPDPARLRYIEQQALHLADRLWTGTAQLAERFVPDASIMRKKVKFIPCGVDAEHFARPNRLQQDQYNLLPKGQGPLAGYFGVINERIDPKLLEALLDVGWRILLIGPDTSHAPKLPSDPRLRWIGPRPYAELPAWLAQFDLALIPYDTRGSHRFLYPVKALEYLAGDRPVLSTPLPDVVRFLSDFVEIADTPLKWRDAGQRLLQIPEIVKAKTRAGQNYARSRSWETMIDEMLGDLGDTPA